MGSTLTKGTGYEDGFWDSFAREDPLTVKQTYALKSEGLEEDLAFPMSDIYIYIYDIPHNTSQLVVSPNLFLAGRAGESGWSQLGLCISSRGGWTPSVEGDSSSISTTLTAEKKVHHSREAVDGNCKNTRELSFLGPSTGW